ncbi:MAG: NifB/NifX family molybdenum-iron cluster-binding protein [Deltaproteobacteria bacterium]|nr:NifB/NifX family molybdenum-iron cluster-binding protein [Deltaproteobacteria bacterium]MBW2052300.1 NifB/NifX family molybdenum-iron cluster-binding protein [Deltaproteobacteria bacterium]MBW2139756.1 NifB/NifX family molybdenum-iron cluster-binding protein [Deltaproteobacteria bacterium]MBW2323001.1 NifB/NifX family molybdenum-iron cluster-binding protein [Deltaproteobacteria bacterium]
MTEKVVVAVPSNPPGGLDAEVSGHFGHCDFFTLVTLVENEGIGEISVLPNVPHEQGGCMAPVNFLAQNGVKVLVAGGMGMRPLMGFNSVGISVFHSNGLTQVGEVVVALAEGRLPRFGQDNTCGGH